MSQPRLACHRFFLFALILVAALAPAAGFARQGVTLTGTVVAGPGAVAGATVTAYAISGGQVVQTPIVGATTAANGTYALALPNMMPLLLVATGGSYSDPILNASQTLTTPLRAILINGVATPTVTISPYSEAVVEAALGETPAPVPATVNAATINNARALGITYLAGVDPQATPPLDATNATAMQGATPAQQLLALALAGLSQSRATNGYTLPQVTAFVARAVGAGGSLFDAGGGYSADPENETAMAAFNAIQSPLASFAQGNQNKTGVASLYNLALTVLGGGPSGGTTGATWTAACAASTTADFAARDALPQTPLAPSQWSNPAYFALETWGPAPSIYPVATIPTGCDPTQWMQYRLLAVAYHVIQQQNNYCHHYIPAWNSAGITFSGGATSYCFPGPATNQATQTGVDCSNFTAFVYNYAFGGIRMTGNVGSQGGTAAGATGTAATYGNAWAPGAFYARPANWSQLIDPQSASYQQYPFQPGDLLYVGPTPAQAAQGVISHVVMWTGIKSPDGSGRYLIADSFGTVNQGSTAPAQSPIPNGFPFANSGTPITTYAGNAGPNLRYFEGSFRATNLVHYRRVIGG